MSARRILLLLLIMSLAFAYDGLDGDWCETNEDCISECQGNMVLNRLCQPTFENESFTSPRWTCQRVSYICNYLRGEECIESSQGPECVYTGNVTKEKLDPRLACPSDTIKDSYEATPKGLTIELKKDMVASGDCKGVTANYVEIGEQAPGVYSPYSKWRYEYTYECTNPNGINPLSDSEAVLQVDVTQYEKSEGDYPREENYSYTHNWTTACSTLNRDNIIIPICDPNVTINSRMPRSLITVDCDIFKEDPNHDWECVDENYPHCEKVGEKKSGKCEIYDVRGEFQPSQGVWQDDDAFDYLLFMNSDVSYRAKLDMVLNRPTLLFGNYHRNDSLKRIVIRGNTTYTSDDYSTVRFILKQPGIKRVIHEESMTLPLGGECGDEREFEIEIYAEQGVPMYDPFYFNKSGPYILEAEVFDSNNESTDIKVSVFGNVVETQPLEVKFDYMTINETDVQALKGQTEGLAATSTKAADYLPLPKDGFKSIMGSYHNFSKYASYDTHERLTDIEDKLTKRSILGGADRLVVSLSEKDLGLMGRDDDVLGFAMNSKVVFVRSSENYHTVAHELVHTMPYLWSATAMKHDCGLDYHNTALDYANGPNPYTGVIRKNYSLLMGSATEGIWISQCTYRHLVKELQKPQDPKVIFVSGKVAKNGSGELSTVYQMDSIIDESVDGNYSIVLKTDAGMKLDNISFNPTWEIADLGVTLDERSFFLRLPYHYNAKTIELYGPSGLLDTKKYNSAPSLEIKYPLENDTTPNIIWARWAGHDSDKDDLLYTVFYSGDNETWEPLIIEENSTAALFQLSNSTKHYLRVLVTDGTQSDEEFVYFTSSDDLIPDVPQEESATACLPLLVLPLLLLALCRD